MAYTPITALPPVPVRGDAPATFATKANDFVAALPTLRTEINNAGTYFDGINASVAANKTAAETAEANAETAEANTLLLEATVLATANFKGSWGDLTGALNKPSSVENNGSVWLLLNNLADVTLSEPSLSNPDWVIAYATPNISSVTVELTANTNGITAGNVVELVSTGGQNVQNIYHCEAPTIGSLVTLDGTNDIAPLAISSMSSTTGIVVLHEGFSPYFKTAKIVSGNPPTLSAFSSMPSNSNFTSFSVSRLNDSNIAISGFNATSSNIGTFIISDNGTNAPVIGGYAAITGTNVTTATCALTSSNWFVAYLDGANGALLKVGVSNGTNAPTLIGTGYALADASTNVNYLSLARLTDTNAMSIGQKDSKGNIVNVFANGTNAPTKSTAADLDSTNNCTYITQSPIDSNHTLCAYNNATTSNGSLAVIQANGTNAPTVISRAVLPEGYPGQTQFTGSSLTAHASNLHTLLVDNASDSKGYYCTIYVDSNYNLTTTPMTGAIANLAYPATAALTPTTAIVAFQSTNSDGFAGTLTLTPTPVISGQLVGIAQTSATNGASASVAVGPLVSGTFTSGADYYVSVAGGLTTNATPVHVLKAKSTTEGVLELRGAPEAGKQLSGEITVPGAFTWTAPYDGEYVLTFCGGGGSGGYSTGALNYSTGGNGGNAVIVQRKLKKGSTISGSIGAGGAGVNSHGSVGNSGENTTVNIETSIYTAGGGLGGNSTTGTAVTSNRQNIPQVQAMPGTTGGNQNIQGTVYNFGGISPLISNSKSEISTAGVGASAVRGAGGTGGTSTLSGAGGSGVFRWELVIGS